MRAKLLPVGLALMLMMLFVGTATANHSWGNYHWARSANPVQLSIGSNVSTAYKANLSTAVSDWDRSTVLSLAQVNGAGLRNCGPVAGRVEVCSDSYGNRGWLGIAQIWASGDHITQGTVQLNDSYLIGGSYNSDAWRQLVTCQEVGHTFGLDHQDENFSNANLGTCMDYTNDPSTNQHPNQHDYDELVTIYSHLDSTTTVGMAAPTNGKAADAGNTPASWGRKVEGSRAAGHSTYLRNDGNGNYLVTFVTWA
jgi:hypothetical protein